MQIYNMLCNSGFIFFSLLYVLCSLLYVSFCRRINVFNDAFCVMGNVGEAERCCHEVRFETRRCAKMRFVAGGVSVIDFRGDWRPLTAAVYSVESQVVSDSRATAFPVAPAHALANGYSSRSQTWRRQKPSDVYEPDHLFDNFHITNLRTL